MFYGPQSTPDWFSCNTFATPDASPYYAKLAPADGSSYIGLVMRGNLDFEPKNEDVTAVLLKPLFRDSIYYISFDAALTPYFYDDFGNGKLYYKNPGKIRISGGKEKCSIDEVFGITDLIKDTFWRKFNLKIKPTIDTCKYLKIEIFLDTMVASYIIVDNLLLSTFEIFGKKHVCQKQQNVIYTLPSTGCTSNFNWNYSGKGASFQNFSESIVVNFDSSATSGILSVSFTNCNKDRQTLSMPIQVDALTQFFPGKIVGENEVCLNQLYTYQITNAHSGKCIWSFENLYPSIYSVNDSSINISYNYISKNSVIKVTIDGACSSTLDINTQREILGEHEVCISNNYRYSINEIKCIPEYQWNYDGQGVVLSANSNQVELYFLENATNGNLSVSINNNAREGLSCQPFPITIKREPSGIANITGDSFVCKNSQAQLYKTVGFENTLSYLWSFSGSTANIIDTLNQIYLSFNSQSHNGNLTVWGKNKCGISAKAAILPILVDDVPPTPEIIGETHVCVNQNSIFATKPNSYTSEFIWNYKGIGSVLYSNNDEFCLYNNHLGELGYLTLAAKNHCGVSFSSEKILFSKLCELHIPNTFSPNGDGINDNFVIRGLPENSKLIVLDRLGKAIYESNNYQNDWNGQDKTGKLNYTDTYWYILTIEGIAKVYKGFIYIKK